jgi:aminomethyltransferase
VTGAGADRNADASGAPPAVASGALPAAASGAPPAVASGALPAVASGALPAAASGALPAVASVALPAAASVELAAASATATRRAAGLFELPERGIVEVAGEDRVRWLDGMLSNDVARLEPGPERSGCRALALTRKGQILADLRVWLRPAALWLETDAAAIPGLLEHLRKLVVADDVRLACVAPAPALLALDGPAARGVLERAAGAAVALAPGAVAELEIATVPVVVAAYAETGEAGFRVAAPSDAAGVVAEALALAGRPLGMVLGSVETFEILRIEAGTPRFGAELGRDVLPAEAGLEVAIAFDKGCYTGQEIVARVESRGQVRRRLAGLRLRGESAPARGATIEADGVAIGAVTSACVSPLHGAIALGFVRIPHHSPGSALLVGGQPAVAEALPFAAAPNAEDHRGRG